MSKFEERQDVVIIDAAVDSHIGHAIMHLSNNDLVSSLNPEWIGRVKAGGRFDDSTWEGELKVRTITLDQLIADHGCPEFIKIDVEGHELKVLEGLSTPVKSLSFEYTPEDIETAIKCIERLQSIGNFYYDSSPGETFVMNIGKYVEPDDIIDSLLSIANRDGEPSGDVYAILTHNYS